MLSFVVCICIVVCLVDICMLVVVVALVVYYFARFCLLIAVGLVVYATCCTLVCFVGCGLQVVC